MTNPAAVASSDRHLSMRTKFFYGFGSVAFGAKDSGFSYFLLIFYNQVMGLPSQTVGLAIMIALLVDAFRRRGSATTSCSSISSSPQS